MNSPEEIKGSPREQLLDKLVAFERALDNFHPERRRRGLMESVTELRDSTAELHRHIAAHVSPRETVEWHEMPDSDAELTAIASELRMEHQEILRALAGLLSTLEEMERSMDRFATAGHIWGQGRPLAERIARHCAGEETYFGSIT